MEIKEVNEMDYTIYACDECDEAWTPTGDLTDLDEAIEDGATIIYSLCATHG
jgi:hypothetical protein